MASIGQLCKGIIFRQKVALISILNGDMILEVKFPTIATCKSEKGPISLTSKGLWLSSSAILGGGGGGGGGGPSLRLTGITVDSPLLKFSQDSSYL